MGWNFRVVITEYKSLKGEVELSFAIHEVYYDKIGRPNGVSTEPSYPRGETLEELESSLKLYRLALRQEPLCYNDLEGISSEQRENTDGTEEKK